MQKLIRQPDYNPDYTSLITIVIENKNNLSTLGKMAEEMDCFKAYDVRGILGETINAEIAFSIGLGFADVLGAKTVALGYDARESSPRLADALAEALMESGADIFDIGQCGSEEIYHATSHFNADGGIMVTASHNPINYNGMKFVAAGSRPLEFETEFMEIKKRALAGKFKKAARRGIRHSVALKARHSYIEKLLSFIHIPALSDMTVLVNCGNGAAFNAYKALKAELAEQGAPFHFIDQFLEPDETFPNGIPNPLLPENQTVTADKVIETKADIGVAFDGDFDRCFFFDEKGQFIQGEYIVGLLAELFLKKEPEAKIVHDARLVMNNRDIIASGGGQAVQSITGHSFVKKALRDHEAVYGGEISAHHYFRDFHYCDSGMIPMLMICELKARSGCPLSELVSARVEKFPSLGETNFKLSSPSQAMEAVLANYETNALTRDDEDGTSLEFDGWRFNLRQSNTEPVIRLNIESRGDRALIKARFAEIKAILERFA